MYCSVGTCLGAHAWFWWCCDRNSGPCACRAGSLSLSCFPSPWFSANKNVTEVPLVRWREGQEETGPLVFSLLLIGCVLDVGGADCSGLHIPCLSNGMCGPQLSLGAFSTLSPVILQTFGLIMGRPLYSLF